MTYRLIASPLKLGFRGMSRAELKEYRARFEGIADERIEALTAEVRATPGYERWQPDRTPGSLDLLGKWMAAQVSLAPETVGTTTPVMLAGRMVDVQADDMNTRSYSIATDVGFYVTAVALNHNKTLRLDQLLKPKNDFDYGHMVVTGDAKSIPTNPLRMTTVVCHRIADGKRDGTALRQAFDHWMASASTRGSG